MNKMNKRSIATVVAGIAIPASMMGAAPAIAATTSADSDGGKSLTLNVGSDLKDASIELVDGDGETLAKGTVNDEGKVSLDYDSGKGDVVKVKIGDNEFELSAASCSLGDDGASDEDSSSTTSTTDDEDGSSSSTSTTDDEDGSSSSTSSSTPTSPSTPTDGDEDGGTDGDGSNTGTGGDDEDTTAPSDDSESPEASEDETPGEDSNTEARAVTAAEGDEVAEGTENSDSGSGDATESDAKTPAGVDLADIAEAITSGDATSLVDVIDKATGGNVVKPALGTFNDLVNALGGYDSVKQLVNMVGGPYAAPVNSVLTLMQSLGLDKISNDDDTTSSTDDKDGSVADDVEDIADDEKALDVKITDDGFSFNASAGDQVDCDLEGLGSTASDDSTAADGVSSSSSTTGDGAKVETGGSIETSVSQPSLWDKFLSLF